MAKRDPAGDRGTMRLDALDALPQSRKCALHAPRPLKLMWPSQEKSGLAIVHYLF
jgi:hypothetical protein